MILIGLGSNLPFYGRTPREIIRLALASVNRWAELVDSSRCYASSAWPDPTDPEFVNAAARIETSLPPSQLLHALHAVEAGFGRRRGARNSPRTLDIDLICYGHHVCEPDSESALRLPHPAIARRAFVLSPLAEIAPDWRHPVTGLTPEEMLTALEPSNTALFDENQ